MRIAAFILFTVFLSGCSGTGVAQKDSPVDQALKICGLGYNTELSGAFKAAFEYADSSGGLNFEGKMREGLETQLGSLSANKTFVDGLEEGELFKLVKQQQDCVVKYTASLRPTTESERLNLCMNDLKTRLSGNGNRRTSVNVKNWATVPDHPDYSRESPVVRFTADYFAYEQHGLVKCISKNSTYQTLEPIRDQEG